MTPPEIDLPLSMIADIASFADNDRRCIFTPSAKQQRLIGVSFLLHHVHGDDIRLGGFKGDLEEIASLFGFPDSKVVPAEEEEKDVFVWVDVPQRAIDAFRSLRKQVL